MRVKFPQRHCTRIIWSSYSNHEMAHTVLICLPARLTHHAVSVVSAFGTVRCVCFIFSLLLQTVCCCCCHWATDTHAHEQNSIYFDVLLDILYFSHSDGYTSTRVHLAAYAFVCYVFAVEYMIIPFCIGLVYLTASRMHSIHFSALRYTALHTRLRLHASTAKPQHSDSNRVGFMIFVRQAVN